MSGKYKSRKIESPKDLNFRPTTGVVREAIFSFILSKFPGNLMEKNILDICAGTGALGLESLSRGAKYVEFWDIEQECIRAINSTLNKLGAKNNAKAIIKSAVEIKKNDRTFDLVFIDPPYSSNIQEEILGLLIKNGFLNKGAIVYVEIGKNRTLKFPEELSLLKETVYLQSKVLFLKYEG